MYRPTWLLVGVCCLISLLLLGHWKRDEVVGALKPHLTTVASTIAEPVPWSWFYNLPEVSRGDVLRRRDFRSQSLEPVPIQRPDNPLRRMDMSPSFRKAWHRMHSSDSDVPKVYRRTLLELAGEDKMAGCGTWVESYTRKHAEWLRSYNDSQGTLHRETHVKLPSRPKRLIAACFKAAGQCGGLGDRIFGHATTFMMSLLLDRIFLMHWAHDFPILVEDTFESPYINWAWQAPPPSADRLDESLDPGDERLHHAHNIFIEATKPWLDEHYSSGPRELVETQTFGGSESMTVQGNKGMLVRALRNDTSWQSQALRTAGMSEDSAWQCVLNYLINPLPDTARLILKYQALLRMPSVFSVGVQVRAGDWVFDEDEHNGQKWTNVAQYDYFFKCAADAAIGFADPAVHKHFVIFLVTDNENLRRHAVDNPRAFLEPGWRHPDIPNFEPLVVSTGSTPMHLEKGNDFQKEGAANTLSESAKHFAMQTSILDNYVFDAVDRSLVCFWSGFGVLSHLRSYPWHGDSSIAMGATGPEGGRPALSSEGVPCNQTKAFRTLHGWADSRKGA